MSTQFKCQKHLYFKLFSVVKQFLFKQSKVSIDIDFIYTDLMEKQLFFKRFCFA